MAQVRDVIKKLTDNYQLDDHIAIAIWCEGDIIGRAQERGKVVTRQQAQQILDTIERKQDCELGISWLTIDAHTDEELEL